MIRNTPLTEVQYFQQPFHPTETGWHAAPVEIDPTSPPDEWTYPNLDDDSRGSSRQPALNLAFAYRVRQGVLQMLYLVAHHRPPGYQSPDDDSSAELFREVQTLDPIDCSSENECGCTTLIGRYPGPHSYYIRSDAWNTLSLFNYTEMTDLLNSIDLDIVSPAAWDRSFEPNLEWWIVRFKKMTQSDFQNAHDRLDELVRWQYQTHMRMLDVGAAYLKDRVIEVQKNGWPRPKRGSDATA